MLNMKLLFPIILYVSVLESLRKLPGTGRKSCIEKTVDFLTQVLKEVNKRFCFVLPAPGYNAVSITTVFTDIQCVVTSQKGETMEVTSDIFLKTDFISKERFVVFHGKLGYGKTFLVLRMLHEVLNNRNSENEPIIIIYVSVQKYDYSTTLFDIVKDQLPENNIISKEDFEDALQVSNTLVILDGFYSDFFKILGDQELTIGTVEPSTTSSSVESAYCKPTSTIAKLLDPAFIDRYKSIKLWVTTREAPSGPIPAHLPFMEVELKGFCDKSRELFISKVFTTLSFPVEKDRETEGIGPTLDDDKQQSATQTSSAMGAETIQGASGEEASRTTNTQNHNQHRINCSKIGLFVDRTTEDLNFLREFCKAPLYLDILVRLTSAKVAYSRNDILFRKLPEWMQEVVSILEWRYLQETSREDEGTKEKLSKLQPELGKIAVNIKFDGQKIVTLNEWTNLLDLKMIKTALSIGFLRLRSQQVDKALSTVVEFQDSYFIDYFAGFYSDSASKAVEQLEDMIVKDTEEETNHLIVFICGYQQSLKEAIINHVLKHNKIYILVDIINLGIDPEEDDFKEILQRKSFIMKIASHDIKKRKYELRKFGLFCQKNNIIVGKISLHCGNRSLLESLKLPPAQQLEFVEQDFGQEKIFSDCLQWLHKQNIVKNCRFKKCRLPETFSVAVQSSIKNLTQQGISVERENSDDETEMIVKPTLQRRQSVEDGSKMFLKPTISHTEV